MVDINVLGDYLRKTRNERKLTMQNVTDKIGINDSVLSKLESGKTKAPSPACLQKLAGLYQIDLVDLYIRAGYLSRDDLSSYQRCFPGVDKLLEEEHEAVKNIIDVIVTKKGSGEL